MGLSAVVVELDVAEEGAAVGLEAPEAVEAREGTAGGVGEIEVVGADDGWPYNGITGNGPAEVGVGGRQSCAC